MSWQGLNLDFTGVVFDGGDFSGAEFSGGVVSFVRSEFSGGAVTFYAARSVPDTLTALATRCSVFVALSIQSPQRLHSIYITACLEPLSWPSRTTPRDAAAWRSAWPDKEGDPIMTGKHPARPRKPRRASRRSS